MYYGYGYYPFFDPTMILVLIGVILSLAASAKVKSTFARYSKVRSMTGSGGGPEAFKQPGDLRCDSPPRAGKPVGSL